MNMRSLRTYRAVCVASLVVLTAFATAAAGATLPGSSYQGPIPPVRPYEPGDQVWTTSDSVPDTVTATPFVASGAIQVAPVRPYRPGDKVWTTSDEVPVSQGPDANGCQRVPASGYISPYVYASTSYEYSNYWYWSGSYSNEPFHWYIRRLSDDAALYDGQSSGGGGSQYTTSNNWRWQVQNLGSSPQAWTACYETQ